MEVLGESCYVLRMCEYGEVEMQMGRRAVFILSKPGVRHGQSRDEVMEGPGGLAEGHLRTQPGWKSVLREVRVGLPVLF